MKKLLLVTLFAISSFAVSAQNTSQSYIEQFKDNAIRIMHETGIPASIVLAVAMHESGNGNSTIAKNLNNQFGIKGGKGSVYYKKKRKVRSSYKKYDSVFESFQDFARIMTERKQFSHLNDKFTQYDYKGWAKGIQRSGYCSSKKWASQVIGIIKRYGLNDLDQTPEPADAQLAENTGK
ncbi:hemagglutinin [Mucilaginibacter limnophilus]|uniref:Hemagglutinin n=1 Tax=Mucilaginibacter limnophilus TaxID=1932778 RepID=A0A3S2Y3T1_9SPHI|nr:glucosaminidase domain-containing protein [Mucilaginibacter limnophilus]RVU01311.1 hemagglutinin [Mucilaginibacter limnophilus]